MLHTDAQALAGLPKAAFDQVAHAQFAADLRRVDNPTLVGEAGTAGDHENGAHARQRRRDVVADPVDKSVLTAWTSCRLCPCWAHGREAPVPV
jgi:hypothetical protein